MEGHRLAPAFAACLALVAAAASAQPPATPPPPAGGGGQTGPRYHELLPDIGLIGAQVGAAIGVSQNPYQAGTGWEVAGFIDLPLARHRSGRLSYEVLMVLSGADGGSSSGRLRLLELSPFALKYTVTRFDSVRLRPYLTAGLDVTLAVRERAQVHALPEDVQASALASSLPAHDTVLALGGHAGAGLELRVSRGLSLNLEYRYARAEEDQELQAGTAALGFHW